MYRGISINLFNLVLSFSDALDLASPELVQHQIRTAYIDWELARKTGMDRGDIENLVEFAIMKQHTYFTYMTLCTVNGLEEIADPGRSRHFYRVDRGSSVPRRYEPD